MPPCQLLWRKLANLFQYGLLAPAHYGFYASSNQGMTVIRTAATAQTRRTASAVAMSRAPVPAEALISLILVVLFALLSGAVGLPVI